MVAIFHLQENNQLNQMCPHKKTILLSFIPFKKTKKTKLYASCTQ